MDGNARSADAAQLPAQVERVTDVGHWRVVIRPTAFEPERIATLKECWQLAEECSVMFRGWDYPHIDTRNRASGNDWIASWSDFRGELEYWRLFQSAQFVHLFALREDLSPSETERIARATILDLRDGSIHPSGYVEVNFTIFTLTEVFEFAARLAARGVLGEHASVRVELHGAKGRALCVLDPRKAWWGFYQASDDVLAKEWSYEAGELAARPAELGRQACVWFFERFQWLNPPLEVIAAEQQKLREGRL